MKKLQPLNDHIFINKKVNPFNNHMYDQATIFKTTFLRLNQYKFTAPKSIYKIQST